MDEAVDRRRRGHWVLEGPIPLAEEEVAGDDHAPALVALGEEREEDFHLLAALLDVADVVEDDGVEAVEGGELLLEPEVTLGSKETLHERERRREEHAVAALDELVPERADEVRLASAGQSEGQDVVASLDEASLAEGGQGLRDPWGQLRALQGSERLLAREVGVVEEALDPATTALVELELGEVVQVSPERPALVLGLLRDLLCAFRPT
jgi:hypothetical protein